MKLRTLIAAALLALLAISPAAAAKPQQFTLKCGLQVLLAEDTSRPLVTSSLWYDAGSRDDPPGRRGTANLMEHLAWGETESLRRGELPGLILRNGGNFSASAGKDRTVFSTALPSNCLDLLLFIEAERMKSLVITAELLNEQKAAVREELKARYLDEPYMLSFARLEELLFQGTGYSHPVMGLPSEIDAITVGDVQEFYRKFYQPRRAVLVLVGDFNAPKTREKLEKLFAGYPAAQPEPPRPTTVPPSKGWRKEVILDGVAKLPAIHVAFPLPDRRTPDYYALGILEKILASGVGSRLERRLVFREKKVLDFSAGLMEQRGRDVFSFFLMLQRNATPEEALAIFFDELERIKSEAPDAKELERARNRFTVNYVSNWLKLQDRANFLGRAAFYDGDGANTEQELQKYLSVSGKDVSAAASRIFSEQNRTILMVVPYRVSE